MSRLFSSHQLPKAPDSPVNVIARASGAPKIPEVDTSGGVQTQSAARPQSTVLPHRTAAPVYLTVPVPTTPAPAPPPMRPNSLKSVMLTEEEFEAGPFALWRLEPSTLILLAMFCGGFYFVVSVLPALDVLGITGGLWSAAAYMIKTAAAITVAVISISAVGLIFEKHMGGLGDITIRTITLHTMIDLAMLAAATVLGVWIGTILVVPVAAILARSMFRLSLAELGFVLLVNGVARLVLVGLIVSTAMSVATS